MDRLILFLLIIFLFECKSYNVKDLEDLPSINVVDSLFLQLDQETPHIFASPQVVDTGGTPLLLNTFINSGFVKFFDFNTGDCIKTIKFQKKGPQKINNLYGTYFFDSIHFILIDAVKSIYTAKYEDSLEIKKVINGRDYKEDFYTSSPLINNNRLPAIILENNKILISNYWNFRKETKTFNLIDTIENNIERVIDVPVEFVDGFYGAPEFRSWNYAYNENKKIIVANFPNQDSLYVYNLTPQLIKKYFVESSLKRNPIKKVVSSDWNIENDPGPEVVNFKVKSNMVYKGLLFDKNNELYYRIVGQPISKAKLESNDAIHSEVREYSIMVIDSDFQLVNEWSVPYNKYDFDYMCYFVHDGHLYLQRFNENEDTAIFDKISLI